MVIFEKREEVFNRMPSDHSYCIYVKYRYMNDNLFYFAFEDGGDWSIYTHKFTNYDCSKLKGDNCYIIEYNFNKEKASLLYNTTLGIEINKPSWL